MSEHLAARTVSIIGLGYIGLPTAAMFASRKVRVIGVDVNPRAVEIINQGRIHIMEPELDMIVHAAVTGGYLRATTRPEPAEAFLIAVPTPLKGNHEPDLAYVEAAAKSIAPVLAKGNIVILESTSSVGTTEQMVQWLAAARPDLRFPGRGAEPFDVNVAYCPERVLPGRVVRELVTNDRIIGGLTEACSRRAGEIYRIFVEGDLHVTDARTAEMAKLTENSFRDVNIAFANELSIICDRLGINVWELIELANFHPRVNILEPGCGVGGHCIAVDPWFIVDKTPEEARLIRSAREVNDHKPRWVIGKVEAAVADLGHRSGIGEEAVRIACFGLAFKANIDDLRESPAVEIAHALAVRYPGRVSAVEPNIDALPPPLAAAGVALASLGEALERAHVLVMLVDHREFRAVAPTISPHQRLCDAKGIW